MAFRCLFSGSIIRREVGLMATIYTGETWGQAWSAVLGSWVSRTAWQNSTLIRVLVIPLLRDDGMGWEHASVAIDHISIYTHEKLNGEFRQNGNSIYSHFTSKVPVM